MTCSPSLRFSAVIGLLLLSTLSWPGREPETTGLQTEKRFPPLKVPAGFKATLFACDPLIEYPSVIAIGPRPGSLFVAIDFMTGLGTDIVRRDEIRLIEDTDGDGYADKATVFASGFNSIQGMAYHNGTVFVMHAPYLTAVRDTKGTGKADERRDLLTGLGLAPEKDQIRLHNANGVVPGHDGWLYLAMGDRGTDVKRPEGDRLVLDGGGILRCRPDGRDLHIFATGLRNIYHVALDEELNVFVRDNENDGGDYKIRVCHSFFGADHGYPYHYYERPDEAMRPIADLGLGSSAGGVCYLGAQFPEEYRGNLFFCEWGRAVVRYPLRRSGASFAQPREIDFAAGAPNDPYGFKPTDLVVGHDGSLFISDWADGQRPKRGRGRIYQVRYAGKPESPPLDKKSFAFRARLQDIWSLARTDGPAAVEKLFALVKHDPDPRIQAQAVRALADLTDPILVRHRLDAGPGDAKHAARFAALAPNRDKQVLLEIIIALGRLRWTDAPRWLHKNLKETDAAIAHAAQWAIRRADNWPGVLTLLDKQGSSPFRSIALRAAAEQFSTALVDGLIERVTKESDSVSRREYSDLLTRVYKQPASPWTYWGFRPPPRPANPTVWERTGAIEQALDRVLADSDRSVRLPLLRRMLREKVPARTATLGRWLGEDQHVESVAVILPALGERDGGESRPHLESVFREKKHTTANRLLGLSLFLQRLDAPSEEQLPATAAAIEDGPILAELLRAIGKRPKLRTAAPFLLSKASSKVAEVRACAVEALAGLDVKEAGEPVRKLLDDPDARVRAAAALAAGKLALRSAADPLLKLVRDVNPEVRRASLDALRQLHEPRALSAAVVALGDPETALKSLEYLGEMGGPEQVRAVTELARRQPSVDVLAAAGKVLTNWASRAGLAAAARQELERSLAKIHGAGTLLGWHVRGALTANDAAALVPKLAASVALPTGKEPAPGWRLLLSSGIDARLRFGSSGDSGSVWLGYSEIDSAEPARVEFFAASTGLATIWLNGMVIHQRDKAGVIGPYPDRFETSLSKGRNRVLVRLSGVKGAADFQLRFRQKSSAPERERLALAALSRAGNPERGRQVFLSAEKSLCIKCHLVGEQGERIGPELTGLGSRFSKVHIVESILEPSRSISPSFETLAVTLKSGKLFNGVKIGETDAAITLADNEGKKHVLARTDIEGQSKSPVSTMPEGLDKRITEDEFVDLISYLVNLKETRGR